MDADVLISWFADTPWRSAADAQFQRPTRFLSMPIPPGQKYADQLAAYGPTPVQAIIRHHYPGLRPLRVAVMGFSEGCQGARAAVGSGDGPRLDAALAFDGIHTLWADQKAGTFDTGRLQPWLSFAKAAIADGRLFLITTSSIVPPTFVSSTITSDWLWTKANGWQNSMAAPQEYDEPPPDFLWNHNEVPPFHVAAGTAKDGSYSWPETTITKAPVKRFRKRNGLIIWNYENMDPSGTADHEYQAARIIPAMETWYLAQRWNTNEPSSGVCMTVI